MAANEVFNIPESSSFEVDNDEVATLKSIALYTSFWRNLYFARARPLANFKGSALTSQLVYSEIDCALMVLDENHIRIK